MDKTESLCGKVPVIERDIEGVQAALTELRDEQRSVRRALYTAAISVTTASVIFFLSVDRWLSA